MYRFVVSSAIMVFCSLPAGAQEAATQVAAKVAEPSPPSFLSVLISLGAFFGIFYYIVIRPQNKKIKEHRNLVDSLKKGDEDITGGGLIGKITAVRDTFVELQVAKNTTVKIARLQIAQLRPKAKEAADSQDAGKKSN
ncbi:MAG: preprotein translocase subunit YajC [bacterium]|nr:preprotein translocase subunit YajC [bacterium]